jgi:hypothetical protein
MGCSHRTYKTSDVEKEHQADLVYVSVPSYIDVLYVDDESTGKYFSKVFISGAKKTVKLLPGPHSLTLVYIDLWPINDDQDHVKLRSHPLMLKFCAEAGKSYRVKGNEPEDLETAKEYAANFKAWIQESESGKIVSQ